MKRSGIRLVPVVLAALAIQSVAAPGALAQRRSDPDVQQWQASFPDFAPLGANRTPARPLIVELDQRAIREGRPRLAPFVVVGTMVGAMGLLLLRESFCEGWESCTPGRVKITVIGAVGGGTFGLLAGLAARALSRGGEPAAGPRGPPITTN